MARKEEAYNYLKNCIIENKFKPNQPIPEVVVAETLHMSRAPIREALRELTIEGFLVSYPSRGCFVSPLSSDDIEEIYALRVLLETWCLKRGLGRISDEKLDSMERAFQIAYESGEWEKIHAADRDFHQIIVNSGHSRRVTEFLERLNGQIERIRRLSAADPKRSKMSYEEHTAILVAMKEHDLEKSCEKLTYHLRSVADSCVEGYSYM